MELTAEYIMWRNTRSRAKRLELPFDLALSDIVIPEFCPVFPKLKLIRGSGSGKSSDASPSIDRIRPELGYTKDNVRVISMQANRLKNNATVEELRAIVDWLDSGASVFTGIIGVQ